MPTPLDAPDIKQGFRLLVGDTLFGDAPATTDDLKRALLHQLFENIGFQRPIETLSQPAADSRKVAELEAEANRLAEEVAKAARQIEAFKHHDTEMRLEFAAMQDALATTKALNIALREEAKELRSIAGFAPRRRRRSRRRRAKKC